MSSRSALLSKSKSYVGLPQWLFIKGSTCNAGDVAGAACLIPGSGSPGEGNGNPLQYSCLENLMDRGARCTIVHGVVRHDLVTI